MLYQFVMLAVLCAAVLVSVSAYLLIKHPQTVERYAKWLGSLDKTGHTAFAVVFGVLGAFAVYDRFWFGVAVYGAAAAMYSYFAMKKGSMAEATEAVR
ncbi:MAG: hypothetical protein JNL96_13950 [Planctomycetaceae bacterium]|nr:hypothetical protein [Planctomycetaceae bacterium]